MMVVAAAGAPASVFAVWTLLPLLELVPYVNGFSFGQLNRSSNTNSSHKNSCCALTEDLVQVALLLLQRIEVSCFVES